MFSALARDLSSKLNMVWICIPIFVVFFVGIKIFNKITKKEEKNGAVAVDALFVTYTCVLLYLTIFTREDGAFHKVNLKFFSTWGINSRNNAFVIENILLFVPYGFLGGALYLIENKLARVKVKLIYHLRFFFFIFASSLSIEIVQLLTGRGFFEIDDIWTNTLGGIVGFELFVIFAILFLHKKPRKV